MSRPEWLEELRTDPCAVICASSARTFHVHVTDGVMDWGPSHGVWVIWRPTQNWARKVARRKAKKVLAEYKKWRTHCTETETVRDV